jgi:hypothetical protein
MRNLQGTVPPSGWTTTSFDAPPLTSLGSVGVSRLDVCHPTGVLASTKTSLKKTEWAPLFVKRKVTPPDGRFVWLLTIVIVTERPVLYRDPSSQDTVSNNMPPSRAKQ